MRAEANLMPERVRIESLGETSDVIITENIVVIKRNELELYSYDEYRINAVSRENLLKSVTESIDMWLDFAKQSTLVIPSDIKRIDILEETQSKVIDTLAEVLGVIL